MLGLNYAIYVMRRKKYVKETPGWMWESKQMTWSGKHFESGETFHRLPSLLLSLEAKWCRGENRQKSEKSSTVQAMQLVSVWTRGGHYPLKDLVSVYLNSSFISALFASPHQLTVRISYI